jgi:ketosteroid isomerase-like protein
MSQEEVDLFNAGLAAWNAGDYEAIVDLCHPDVEWTFSDRLPDATGHIRGKAEVWDIEVSMRFIHVWTVRDGQIVRFRGFSSFEEALGVVSAEAR